MLVTIESFIKPWEAHLLRMRLEAEDIPAFVTHEFHVWTVWPYALALGGAKIQVPTAFYEEAREIQALCNKGSFKTLLEESFGDLDDIHCPYCLSRDFGKRTSVLVAAAATLSTLLTGAVFPAKATIYDCNQCSRSWRRPLGIPVYQASLVTVSLVAMMYLVWMLWLAMVSPPRDHGPATYPFSRYPSEFPAK